MATLSELQERLALYRKAEASVLQAQEYQYGSRRWTRANLSEIRAEINSLENRIAAVRNNGLFGHSVAVFGGRR